LLHIRYDKLIKNEKKLLFKYVTIQRLTHLHLQMIKFYQIHEAIDSTKIKVINVVFLFSNTL
jgi:hypothetical protein